MKKKKIYLTYERCEHYISVLKSINEFLLLPINIDDNYERYEHIIFQHNITNLLAKINNNSYRTPNKLELDNTYLYKDVNINVEFFKEHCIEIDLLSFSKKDKYKTLKNLGDFSTMEIDKLFYKNNFLNWMNYHITDIDTLICSLIYTLDSLKKYDKDYIIFCILRSILCYTKDSPYRNDAYLAKEEQFKKYGLKTILFFFKNNFTCIPGVLINDSFYHLIDLTLSLERIELFHSNLKHSRLKDLASYFISLNESKNIIKRMYEKYPFAMYQIIVDICKYYNHYTSYKTRFIIDYLRLEDLDDTKLFTIEKYLSNNKEYRLEIYEELAKRNIPYADKYISKLMLNTLKSE